MSEMTQPAEQEAANHLDDDPIRTIIEAEARANEKFFRQAGHGGEEEKEDTPPPSEEKAVATEKTRDGKSKRPGVDVLLKEVEEKIGSEAAEVIRGLQTQLQGRRREREENQKAIAELNARLDALAKPQGAQAAQNDPLAGLTPQQWEVFNEMARRAGLVNKQEITERDASGFVQKELRSAVERHGERFGSLDEETGEFVPSEESEEEMRHVYERIYDAARGLTAKDLYVLARHDDVVDELKQQIEELKKNGQAARKAEKVESLKKASVERVSSNGVPSRKPAIYKRGESLDNVVARAFAETINANS